MIATGQSQQILGLENAFGTRDRVNFHMEREIQRLLLPGLSVGAKSLWHSVRISFFWFVRAISQPVTSCLPTSREQSAGRPWGERRRESMPPRTAEQAPLPLTVCCASGFLQTRFGINDTVMVYRTCWRFPIGERSPLHRPCAGFVVVWIQRQSRACGAKNGSWAYEAGVAAVSAFDFAGFFSATVCFN